MSRTPHRAHMSERTSGQSSGQSDRSGSHRAAWFLLESVLLFVPLIPSSLTRRGRVLWPIGRDRGLTKMEAPDPDRYRYVTSPSQRRTHYRPRGTSEHSKRRQTCPERGRTCCARRRHSTISTGLVHIACLRRVGQNEVHIHKIVCLRYSLRRLVGIVKLPPSVRCGSTFRSGVPRFRKRLGAQGEPPL
jgi:hypothetical protein